VCRNMPTRKVKFEPGKFYHVFNRGNGKQDIFYNDKDRYRFLQAMYLSNNSNSFRGIEKLDRGKSGYTLADIENLLNNNDVEHDPLVKICADCLMPNHFHFLLQEIQKDGIIRFMQKLGNSYARYFTEKYGRPGSLFQGRFKAVCVESDEFLKYLLFYINILNPAQLLEPNLKEEGTKKFNEVWQFADNYNWGTHQEFMGRRKSILIDKGLLGEIYNNEDIYMKFVKDLLRSKERNKIWGILEGLTLE